jgi:hypothetical protein
MTILVCMILSTEQNSCVVLFCMSAAVFMYFCIAFLLCCTSKAFMILWHVHWKPEQFNQQRWPLQGNILVNTLSLWQRRCHTAIGELWEVLLPHSPTPGGLCHCSGTHDTMSPTSTEEQCFLLGPCTGYVWWIKTQACQSRGVRIESLERVYRQADQVKSKAVVRQSPLTEAWEVEESSLL